MRSPLLPLLSTAALLLLLAVSPRPARAQLITFDIDNVESSEASGPLMFPTVFAYRHFDWNTDALRPLSASVCTSENVPVLGGTAGVTVATDDYVLHSFHHINGGTGDRRVYINGVVEIEENGVSKIRLDNCRFTVEVDYQTSTTTGDGWCVIDAASSDADWVSAFDVHGTGQVEMAYSSISAIVQGDYGYYDFEASIRAADHVQALAGQALTTAGGTIDEAIDFGDVQMTFSSATYGGPGADLNQVMVNQIETAAGGAPPAGVETVLPDQYWQIGTTLASFNTTIDFDLSGFTGIVDPSKLRILRRETPTAPWTAWPSSDTELVGGTVLRARNVTGFSEWAIGGEAGALPVELTRFEGLVDGQDVLLRWETASETNNVGFHVEQFREGAFTSVGFVAGQGTTLESTSYTHRLDAFTPGRYTFRLKQIDFDGSFTTSPAVEVIVGVPEAFVRMPASPNPFSAETEIRFAVREASPLRIHLYNAAGQLVRVLYDAVPQAGQTQAVRIDGSTLPSGVYLVRFTGAGLSATEKLVLMR